MPNVTGGYEFTPEMIREVWDKTRKPNALKVSTALRQIGVRVGVDTIKRMRSRGWVEVRRGSPKGRPRATEKKKTTLNKSIVVMSLLTGAPVPEVQEALGLSQKVLDFLAGLNEVSFADVADELNKAFGRCIAVDQIAITSSNMAVKRPKQYAAVQPVITAAFQAFNEPKVLGNFVAGMKTISPSDRPIDAVNSLDAFLTANGG